jgi:shikimate dehydrogenase
MARRSRENKNMTAIRIDGATRLYVIVGDPIVQVKSPEVFSALFARAGMNAVMIPMHVLPQRFEESMRALMGIANLDGLVATVPYKAMAVRFAHRLGPTANRIGALNALRREPDGTWTGEMFDGAGFVRAAERKGEALRGRRVALFGAGGAGSAIGCELAAKGVEALSIIDPQRERATTLAKTLRAAFPACRVDAVEALPSDVDMIVNASTIGMREVDGLPGDIGPLAADTLVGDVVVSQEPTALIRHAIRHGCPYVTGRDMLNGQSDALVSFFGRG